MLAQNRFVLRILTKLWSSQVEALKEALGSGQMVDLLEPFILRMSHSGTLKMKSWLGIEEGGLEGLSKVFSVMVPANVRDEPRMTVFEDGMTWEPSSECPFRGAAKEMCLIQDVLTAQGSLEAFGLEREYELKLDFGNPIDALYCQAAVNLVRKGRVRPEGRLVSRYSSEELRASHGQEWIDDLSIQYKAEFFVQTTNMAIEELGVENAESVLIRAAEEVGRQIAEMWIEEELAKGFDVNSHIELLAILGESMRQGSEISSVGKNDMIRKVRSCPFSDSNPLVCAQLEAFTSRLCSELFPGSFYETRRVMTKGDDHCSFGIKVSSLDGDDIDPLQILKIRFAKGEISEMEYLRMRNLLTD